MISSPSPSALTPSAQRLSSNVGLFSENRFPLCHSWRVVIGLFVPFVDVCAAKYVCSASATVDRWLWSFSCIKFQLGGLISFLPRSQFFLQFSAVTWWILHICTCVLRTVVKIMLFWFPMWLWTTFSWLFVDDRWTGACARWHWTGGGPSSCGTDGRDDRVQAQDFHLQGFEDVGSFSVPLVFLLLEVCLLESR